jgi:long-chain acyl-CoA synthetase
MPKPNDPYAARPWIAHYCEQTPADIHEDSYSTLNDMFRQSVAAYANRVAATFMGSSITYRELDLAADAVASWLQSRSIRKGDRIAIMSPNLMAYPAILFGVLRAGGVIVNVNPLYTPTELEHQINDSGARMIFVLENFAHTVAAAWPQMNVETVVIIRPGDLLGLKGAIINLVSRYLRRDVKPYRLPTTICFAKVVSLGRKTPSAPVEVTRDDIAFLQYTGGTTGAAKGAVLLHRNVAANVEQSERWLAPYLPPNQPQIMVTALPLYHIFGLTACCLVMTRIGGSCLLIANPRDINGFVKTLRKSKFTLISGVNTLFAALADNKDFRDVDFSKLFYSIAGGMAMQHAVARRWKQLTGKPVIEGYGLSETSPIVTCNRPDLPEFSGTIGYPVSSTFVSLRTPEGEIAPAGERGELCIKGPQVMAGYWNKPADTAAAMTSDGYLRTGDVGIMLEDGQFKIVDRLKEMILVSGFNVYPNEVENVLVHHPKVKEAAVIGVPDPHSGETVMAFIVPRDPNVTREELHDFARESLTSYKVPKYFEFRDSLPKSTVGKVLRRMLRDEMAARRASLADEGRGKSVRTEQRG